MTPPTSSISGTILLIDDDPRHANAILSISEGAVNGARECEWVRTLATGLDALSYAPRTPWAIFLNLFLPDSRGLATLDRLLPIAGSIPIVVMAGAGDEALCEIAMSRGAKDYLLEGHLDSYAFTRAIRGLTERETDRRDHLMDQVDARTTLDSIGDAVLSVDVAGRVTYLNPVAEHTTGWSNADALGRPLTDVFQIIDSVTRRRSRNPLALAMKLDKAVALTANCVLIRRDGHEVAIEDSAAPIRDRSGRVTGAVIAFHDVTAVRSEVLELSHGARHDVLTGLPNRLVVKDRLTQAILLARRHHGHVGVLFLDVDGFKRVNDTLGHTVGDGLLQSIAARLSHCVRVSDTVSRQGGDEFVILLPEIARPADASLAASKIVRELTKPHSVGEHRLSVTASIGVSVYPGSGDDADALIANADVAMYHAKERGRDNYQSFTPEMSLRAVERQSLEQRLRTALEDEELVLHFQPKVDLRTGVITSAEALIRWQHPDRGLLFPAQFLGIAEDSGMIVPLGRWVLNAACKQTRQWLDAGLPAVPVAVNVSALELRADRFAEGIEGVLKDTRLDPRYLELELTETVMMRSTEPSTLALEGLRAAGVRLAIDDFGTGYSSLSYLTRLPIDALKLDQSFVHGIGAGSSQSIVAGAVIKMAKRLKHRIIAEGVETAEQVAFLRTHGCDEGQGYYFSPPVAAEQFARLLDSGVLTTAMP